MIDNGSTDGTLASIEPLLENPNYFYYNTGENLGGAGGFHFGIKTVVELGYDYIWIMDDDTIPQVSALDELLQAKMIVGENFGFLASCVIWTNGDFCKMNNPGIMKEALYGQEYRFLENGIINIHHASFVSVLFRADVIKEMGLPIKEFFIWKDDYEYTSRISTKYRGYYVSRSIVVHKMKNNSLPDIVWDDEERLGRYVFEFRNEYYLVRKQKKRLHFYYNTVGTIGRIIKSKTDHKWKRICIILNGVKQGWGFKPEIEFCVQEKN